MGPSSVISPEEDRLEHWIIAKAKLGFPMHPDEVKDSFQKIVQDLKRENPFVNDRPGRKWMELFLKRHSAVTRRNKEIISNARASVTEQSIKDWFNKVFEHLKSEKAESILNEPNRIFNLETGVKTCLKSGKLLGPKKYSNFYEIASGPEKECISVLCSFNAAGDCVDPVIIYPYKRIPRDIAESVPSNYAIGRSDSGWMVSETFYEYIANIFYPRLIKSNVQFPVLVFMDGHKSHINEHLYEFCVEKKLLLFCLLPNATHILQPCDVAIFKPLKNAWRKVMHKYKKGTTKAVSKVNFAPLFSEAMKEVTKSTIIQNGFKATGLYPFNSNNVDYSKCISTRRVELFDMSESSNKISLAEYRTALKVAEEEFSEETLQFFIMYTREVES